MYTHLYVYIYIYSSLYVIHIHIHIYIYIYVYGRFPRPASTKNAKVDKRCVRIEQFIPYQSKNIGVT